MVKNRGEVSRNLEFSTEISLKKSKFLHRTPYKAVFIVLFRIHHMGKFVHIFVFPQ